MLRKLKGQKENVEKIVFGNKTLYITAQTIIDMEKTKKNLTRKPNPWLVHLAKTRKDNPTVKDVVKLSQIAKKTYKK